MHHELTPSVQSGLAVFYVLAAAMNAGYAYYHVKHRNRPQASLWLLAAGAFLVHAFLYLAPIGRHLVIPTTIADWVDWGTNAVTYFVLSTVGFILVLLFRKQLTSPAVAWGLIDLTLLAFGWAMTNSYFR